MQKNDKGITMIALAVTILVLVILTGVSFNAGFSVMKDIRVGRIISNLVLVKAKAETIYEQYQFSGEESDLIGTEVTIHFISDKEKEIIGWDNLHTWIWYKWDSNILKSQGLDSNLLGDNEYFYINYEHAEVIYSQGTSYDDETYYYSLTGLNHLYQNEK